jgi:hypothetical protein
MRSTLTLPPHRLDRLFDILRNSIGPNQKRVSLQKWHSMLGELRAMTIAIPGARGFFSHLQAALQPRNLSNNRIRVSNHVQATLQDFTWLAESLQERPTRLNELVLQQPCLYGTIDASGKGMGGVILPPPSTSAPLVLWRLTFPLTSKPSLHAPTIHPELSRTRTWSWRQPSSTTMSCVNSTTRANAPFTPARTTKRLRHGSHGSLPPPTRHQHSFYASKPSTNVITNTSPCTRTYLASSMPWRMMPRDCGTCQTNNYSHTLILRILSTNPGTSTNRDPRCILP